MSYDLQKASMWKRIAAWMFDIILLSVLVVGFGYLLSNLLGYDAYSVALDDAYARYETEYNVVFDISQEERKVENHINKISEQHKSKCNICK